MSYSGERTVSGTGGGWRAGGSKSAHLRDSIRASNSENFVTLRVPRQKMGMLLRRTLRAACGGRRRQGRTPGARLPLPV